MRRRIGLLGAAVTSLLWAGPAAATVTIGTTAVPSGGTLSACNQAVAYVQPTFDAATSYEVPAGGGELTSWSMFASSAFSGVPERLLVVRPGADDRHYSVVGTDPETFPTPIPASGIVTFTLNPPLSVSAGDELGVFNPSASDYCLFSGSSLPGYALETDPLSPPPAAGNSLTMTGHTEFDVNPRYELNLAATLDNDEDAGVTATASTGDTAGVPAAFGATVTDNGPAAAPITFTDTISPGLTINSAVAGGGTCAISGQLVTCTITAAPGQSMPVSIAVTAPAAGGYSQTVAVGTGSFTDPVTANNAAGSTLSVAAPAATPAPPSVTVTVPAATPPRHCHIPRLYRTPVKIARGVISALGCKVGRTTSARSKTVAKGLVISTTPKAGSSPAAGQKIALRVSSGPPPRAKKHRR